MLVAAQKSNYSGLYYDCSILYDNHAKGDRYAGSHARSE